MSDELPSRDALRALQGRCARRPVAPLSYATVRDYCESADWLPFLAVRAHDLKDVQRPWALKALLAVLPPGARVLEFGAGEPMIAECVARLGHRVTVVDPYDGSGHGPREHDLFRRRYPSVEILREEFTRSTPVDAGRFDVVYSISVLEHLSIEQRAGVADAIARVLRPGGWSIHAIDHVVAGGGALFHAETLRATVELLGGQPDELEPLLARAREDVETYYLSAYGHHLWRGGRTYEEFPMRTCMSVQVCTQPVPGSDQSAPSDA